LISLIVSIPRRHGGDTVRLIFEGAGCERVS
jgi:hypothetical protein